MTYEDVVTIIDSVGVPSAYYQFPNDTEQVPPFICFYYQDSDDMFADDINYVNIQSLVIELYTREKEFELEKTLENALINANIPFSRVESYIDTEQMLMQTYNMEVLING